MTSSVDDILFSPIAEAPKVSSKPLVPEILDRLRPLIQQRLSCYSSSMNTEVVRQVIRVDIGNYLRPYLSGGSGIIQHQVICDQANNIGGLFSKIEVWIMVEIVTATWGYDTFWMKFQV